MTALEEKLSRYKEPSSNSEKEKQDRAERMVRGAVESWSGFDSIAWRLLPKGSYKNNTNVRTDSDVDIAVIHEGFYYFNDSVLRPEDKIPRTGVTSFHYAGLDFRGQLEKALCAKFGTSQCDTTGKTAITISENTGRVSADAVPSFEHWQHYYDQSGRVAYHVGTTTPRTDGTWVINYPEQQYANGVAKNNRTNRRYKYQVRILKRLENDLVAAGSIKELPSYFMECLVYRVPDSKFGSTSWTPLTDDLKTVLAYIYQATEPGGAAASWLEPNDIKSLFGGEQPWSMADAHTLTSKAWNYLNLG